MMKLSKAGKKKHSKTGFETNKARRELKQINKARNRKQLIKHSYT